MDKKVRLERQEKALVLADDRGRQILLTDYGDEVGIWFKFLKKEIRISKLFFISQLFKD